MYFLSAKRSSERSSSAESWELVSMRISSSNSEGSPIAGAVVTCGAGVTGGTAAGAGEVMAEIFKRYYVKKGI